MLKYEDYLKESLAAQVLDQPKSNLLLQAEKLGLTYVGFGRFADNSGNVTYMVNNGKLVPFGSQEDAYANYNKASMGGNNEKAAELKKQADEYTDVLYKRTQTDQKIMSSESQMIMQVDAALKEIYNDSMFDSMEINMIRDFTSADFDPINLYLYQGFDPGTDQQTADGMMQTVSDMDMLIADSQAPFNYSVYTCLSPRYNPSDIESGQTYIFRGYVSASLDYNVCIEASIKEMQAQSITLLQIDLMQGQNSLYTEAFTQSGDMETILPRGSKIGIVSGPHSIPSDVVLGQGSQIPITMFYCQLMEEI